MSTTTLAKAGTKNVEQVILLDATTGDPASLGGGTQYADGTAAATPTGTVAMFDDGGTITAVSDSNPLPVSASIDTTGLATEAKQDTIIGHLDGVETVLGTIDTDTGAIATSTASIDTKTPALGQALAAASVPVVLTAAQVTTLTPPAAITGFATAANQLPDGHNVTVDNASIAVTGTFWQATQPVSGTVTAELSGTDNAVLDDIAANQTDASQKTQIVDGSGNVIAATSNALNVHIASGASSGTQYTEGDTDASITGTALMWEDAADTLTPVSSSKPLPVSVTGGGDATAANQTTIIGHVDGIEGLLTTIDADTGAIKNATEGTENLLTGVSYTDDGAWDAGASVLMIGAVLDDATPNSVDEGDAGHLRITANRALHSTIRDAAGNERGANVDASNRLTVVADLGSTDNGVLDAIAASTAAADTDLTTIIGHLDGVEGILTTMDADTGGILTAVQIMDDWDNAASDGASVSGDVAHDTADAGEPVKIGFKAESSPKGITLVADGDRTNGYADLDGLQMVKLNTANGDLISERVSNTDGSSTAFTNFSSVASTRNYITGFSVFRTDAGTTPIYVDFRDGTAGSILWSAVIPPNGGANNPAYCGPALFRTSAATALAYDVSAATSTVYISVSGYQSKA